MGLCNCIAVRDDKGSVSLDLRLKGSDKSQLNEQKLYKTNQKYQNFSADPPSNITNDEKKESKSPIRENTRLSGSLGEQKVEIVNKEQRNGEKENSELNKKGNILKDRNKTLEKESLETTNKLDSKKENISALEENLYDLLKKKEGFDEKVRELNDKNGKLVHQTGQYETDWNNLFSESKKLEDEKSQMLEQKKSLDTEIEELQQKLQYQYSQAVDPNNVLFIALNCESLSTLFSDGWTDSNSSNEKTKKLQAAKLPLLGVLGESSAGKSWVANQLAGNNQLQFGQIDETNTDKLYYIKTSLNFSEDSGWLTIFDPKGSNTALSVSDEGNFDKYQALIDESKFIDTLRLDFMIKYCGIIVFVVGKLTGTDIISIRRISQRISQLITLCRSSSTYNSS